MQRITSAKSNFIKAAMFSPKWLPLTQSIAFDILEQMEAQKIDKHKLKQLTNFSSEQINLILKGHYSLTINNINTLEKALKPKLLCN